MNSKLILSAVLVLSIQSLAFGMKKPSIDHPTTAEVDSSIPSVEGENKVMEEEGPLSNTRKEESCVVVEGIIVPEEEAEEALDPPLESLPDEPTLDHALNQKITRLFSAAVAAGISSGTFYPIDQIKASMEGGSSLRKAVQLGRLYRGFSTNALMMCTTVGLATYSYDDFREQGDSKLWAGIKTSAMIPLVTNPGWVFQTKRRLAKDGATYTWIDFWSELKKNPKMATYGMSASAFLAGPQTAFLVMNELLSPEVKPYVDWLPHPYDEFSQHMISAGMSNVLATGYAYPLNVLRTLMQKHDLTWWQAVDKINSEGGFLSARVWRSAPFSLVQRSLTTGMTWAIYRRMNNELMHWHRVDEGSDSDLGSGD